MHEITPCLWFDTEGEEAAGSTPRCSPQLTDPGGRPVRGSRARTRRNGDDGELRAGRAEVRGLERGPEFTFSEGGEEGPWGWLKDRYGVSWQVVPTVLAELLSDPDPQRSQRVMRAMLQMKKLEIDALERAAAPA